MITIYILIWLVCGIIAYGMSNAYFIGKYGSRNEDFIVTVLYGTVALLGTIWFLVEKRALFKYGWKK